jgi:hypothetical protein
MSASTAAQVRAGLSHPVVDADGHWVEYHGMMIEALTRIGGERAAQRYAYFGRALGPAWP